MTNNFVDNIDLVNVVNMPKISVIVPIYNTEKYLHRCIDSILAQTYTDFELLLIDDGSTDSSGTICDEYAAKEPRVRVFHKENGGVSSARNMGLDNALGEWISFVDSDDWVEVHYLDILYQKGKYDFVTCYWEILNCKNFKSVPPIDEEYQGSDMISIFLDKNRRNLSCPVCRLYKSSIIRDNEIRFDLKISFAEDALFNLTYLLFIKSAKSLSDVCYFYEKHPNSLSDIVVPWSILDYAIWSFCVRIEELETNFAWNGEAMKQHYVWGLFLRRHLTYLQYNESLLRCRSRLKEIWKNPYVRQIFFSTSDTKGKSRNCFDFLIRNKMFFCAALFLKIEYWLIKYRIVNRA